MTLRHLLRMLGRFWKSSLDGELEYRGNFIIAALASLGSLVGSAFSLSLFYRGHGFAGWSLDESVIVLGLFTGFSGFVTTFLSPNLSRIATHVSEGTLDFVLLKPIDAQLHVSVRALSPWGVPDLVLGLGLVIVGSVRAGVTWSHVPLALVPLFAGALILYALWFTVATTSIWFTKIYNATEVLRGLLEAGRFPMGAYPAAYRFVFTFLVPVAFLTTVPAEALLGRVSTARVLGSLLAAAVMLVGSRALWVRALRSYTGASG